MTVPAIRASGVPTPPKELWQTSRATRRYPCPICGGSGACFVIPSGKRVQVWCVKGEGEAAGQHIVWGALGSIWYFDLANDGTRRLPPARRHVYPVANAATLDGVLRAVAAFYGLSDAHRAALASRGYDAWECGPDGRYLFASLPADPAGRYAWLTNKLLSAYAPDQLLGVYGVSRDGRSRGGALGFLAHVGGAALLEFSRDETGRIVGYQYAPDTPALNAKGKPQKRLTPPRFETFGRYHAAMPAGGEARQVWHTEGQHKANLVALHKGVYALSAFGIGGVRGLLNGARALDPKRRMLHVVALDWDSNADTDRARLRLITELRRDRFRVALARWDGEIAKGPDDAIAAGLAIELGDPDAPEPSGKRDLRHDVLCEWQHRDQPFAQHQALMDGASRAMASRVETHLKAKDAEAIYLLAAAPGLGKTHEVSEIGAKSTAGRSLDVAWIAQRHDMAGAVPGFATYREIQPPNERNCPMGHGAHHTLSAAGYATHLLHTSHPQGPCDYIKQFHDKGSAIYQLPHVVTPYPGAHKAVIVDEFDLSQWLGEYQATLGRLRDAAAQFTTEHPASVLCVALEAVLTDCKRDRAFLHGKGFLDALDCKMAGHLAQVLGTLGQDARATDLRPLAGGIDYEDTPSAIEDAAARLPRVILPHIWHGLAGELAEWQRGAEYNSCLRVGVTPHGDMALFITRPLRLHTEAASKPLAILDATPPPERLLARIFGRAINPPYTPPAIPPARMRHIAVRTGTRYGKASLTAANGKALRSVVAQCRYELRRLDPDGSLLAAGGVGIVTFAEIEAELAEALGVAYKDATAHYWACRGANHLNECSILLCVGTPTLPPDETLRIARAIYRGDAALDESSNTDEDGHYSGYADPRLAELSRYLTYSEMTQAAHRNRPLRHEARVVVTFCNLDEIGYLPATTVVEQYPLLATSGEARAKVTHREQGARLEAAVASLNASGEAITGNSLAKAAGVSKLAALRWIETRKSVMYTDLLVPEGLKEIYISPLRTKNTVYITSNGVTSPDNSQVSHTSVTQRQALSFPAHYEALIALGLSPEDAAKQALQERGSLPT